MTKEKEDSENINKEIKKAEDDAYNLTLLTSVPLFDKKQLNKLSELKDDLAKGFKTRQIGRPKYLMEVSVLKDMKFPTSDSKYWQCILERDVQFQNLLFEACDFKEKNGELLIIEEDLKSNNHLREGERMKLEAQRLRLLLQLMLLKKQADERYREIMAWSELIERIKTKLKYSDDNPEEHMPESFLIRFAEQKKIIDQIGATDMNGAMNIIGLGQTAARYWKEKKTRKRSKPTTSSK